MTPFIFSSHSLARPRTREDEVEGAQGEGVEVRHRVGAIGRGAVRSAVEIERADPRVVQCAQLVLRFLCFSNCYSNFWLI